MTPITDAERMTWLHVSLGWVGFWAGTLFGVVMHRRLDRGRRAW